ncbi:hypothetical protein IQ241_23595 [Romeria aff. gracilis LEGE 07310]|uniref:Uncharacterized protein n=1 Tax=Vasconcelosia minhoensis LEGE 07310 TaxID=915328 RepID=A0A8J7ATH2_9CYAN|nr:hypothetical protein [Romeria gracilis]MBE9080235.1 hypothetical protein [Romeria aff. gracilis LEGE 07310]
MTAPLQRLQVNDGLLITADRWQVAHGYHQQRQTIHYEALHQGGIVSGLGVSVGPIPDAAASKYRQPRWLTIQPGLAIDAQGNPIVVTSSESCYLSAQPSVETTIYIVLKHSDRLAQVDTDIVQEAFQILEKNGPAEDDEVELCRVRLTPGGTGITPPEEVFSPGLNQLDLRYRQVVQPRPQLTARVAAWSRRSEAMPCFQALFKALPGLYPAIRGEIVADAGQSDLSHLSYDEFCQLGHSQQIQMAQYLRQGGVLLVEANADSLGELYQVEAELRSAIAARRRGSTTPLQASAEQELSEIQACIGETVAQLAAPIRTFLDKEGLTAHPTGRLAADHGARSHPFRFGQWPTINSQPIGLYGWGGLLLLVGPLTQGWGQSTSHYGDPGEWFDLSREEIRSAQELGINLLSFAARRRQLHQWLMPHSGAVQ